MPRHNTVTCHITTQSHATSQHNTITCASSVQALDRKDPAHVEYWAALATLAQHELAEAQKRDELDCLHLQGVRVSEEAVRREAGLHPAVERDIEGMLTGGLRGLVLEMLGATRCAVMCCQCKVAWTLLPDGHACNVAAMRC